MKAVPKTFESILSLYPLVHLSLVAISLFFFFAAPSFINSLFLIFVSYFLSPLIWKSIKLIWGDIPTVSYLGKHAKGGNLWFISYRLQHLYNSYPLFENILKFIPGCYSAWLRLWGSTVGKKINWAPETTLVDRTNLILGDRILVGNKTYITSHVIKKKENKYFLFFKSVEIGNDSLISFSCTLGPGLVLPERSFLKAFSVEYQNSDSKEKVSLRDEVAIG